VTPTLTTSTPKRRGRPPGSSDTRDRILVNARKLFACNGIDKTSIRSIAAAAGVDSALIHHYFGTKQQLFVAAIRIPVDPMVVLGPVREAPVEELGRLIPSLLLPLWPAAAGIALMSFTESIAAGRAFHRRGEARIGPDQELLATGVASVAAGFFGAMPCGGGTSQTAVNASAGARTQVAGLVTAAGALATMLFLAPAMGALPYATLAAVVVAYSIGLIDPAEIAAIRRVRLPEFRWAIVALAGVVLLGTLKGILVAVVLSLLSLLYQSSNPPVYAVRRRPGSTDFEPVGEAPMTDPALPGLLIARAEGRIYFGNAQTIGDKLRALIEATAPKVLILDCRAILDFEYTALKGLVDWELSLRQQGIEVWLAALNPEALAQVRRTTLAQTLGERRLFPSLHAAVAAYESDTNTCSQAAAVAGSEDQR
ncbi:MAG: TetR family transcriptional regulator, partial [Pseudomonadales bacterium]|nr:TetR family transcriptional regulator [Pseudomonadales bacterium]